MNKEEMLKKIELVDCAFDFDELYDSDNDEWFNIHDLFFQIKEIIKQLNVE